jgi:enoyl-CoA hydratase/carnithine racemase
MAYQDVLYHVADRVATVTLNRPDKLNAWTARMEEEATQALREAANDDNVRAIILTGAGRGFCAGADMSLLRAVSQSGAAPTVSSAGGSGVEHPNGRPDFRRKHVWLLSIPKPVIAAINGPAVGLGFVIPLYCDLRIASEQARFSTIFGKRGLVAEYGLAWMLPRLVGLGNAVELLFSAHTIDAAEALRIGLVNRVIAQEEFLESVQSYAAEMAANLSPRSLRVMKHQIYEAQFQTLGQAMDLASEEMMRSFDTEDFREGVAHFVEKRAPAFTGR